MPPRTLIAPAADADAASAISIVSLPHPRTSVPTRYLLHSARGLHEITKVASASKPRSWLIADPAAAAASCASPEPATWVGNGQVIQDGALYVSTPMDPLFLLVSHLLPPEDSKSHFVPLDDMLETLASSSKSFHWDAVLRSTTARKQVEARLRAACEVVDIGDEKAYRVSQERLLQLLAKKCETIAAGALPQSMEAEFVAKPLVRPVSTGIAVAGAEGTKAPAPEDKDKNIPDHDSEKSQLFTPPESQDEVAAALPPPLLHGPADGTAQLLRIRTAAQFIAASYLPAHIATFLLQHLAGLHDFGPLDTYLSELKRLRAEAVAIRAGDFTRKRALGNEEVNDERAEKRKKEDEEKKKKKSMSKGVKELSKVNTRGMAKMTSFFKKKE